MKKALVSVAVMAVGFCVGTAMAGDPEAGKQKAQQICVACHGLDGVGLQPIYPNIGGQKEQYIISSLKAFKSGERKNPIMSPMAMPLTDADIENVAAYYSGLK